MGFQEETVVKSVLKPVTVDKTQSNLMMYPSDEEEESMGMYLF